MLPSWGLFCCRKGGGGHPPILLVERVGMADGAMGRWADFGRITANVSSFPSKAFDLKAILKVFFSSGCKGPEW